MNDRELLELAAKAAGIIGTSVTTLGGVPAIRINPHDLTPWNPLTDDGDALRLAVKLRIGIEINERSIVASWVGGEYELDVVYVNHDTATRRAIVRVAAEICLQMQEGGVA